MADVLAIQLWIKTRSIGLPVTLGILISPSFGSAVSPGNIATHANFRIQASHADCAARARYDNHRYGQRRITCRLSRHWHFSIVSLLFNLKRCRSCASRTVVETRRNLDPLIAADRWLGRRFNSIEYVQPLLHTGPYERPYSVNPTFVPMHLAAHIPISDKVFGFPVRDGTPRIGFWQKVYNAKPIIDVFREIDVTSNLSMTDHGGDAAPSFFV